MTTPFPCKNQAEVLEYLFQDLNSSFLYFIYVTIRLVDANKNSISYFIGKKSPQIMRAFLVFHILHLSKSVLL